MAGEIVKKMGSNGQPIEYGQEGSPSGQKSERGGENRILKNQARTRAPFCRLEEEAQVKGGLRPATAEGLR